MGRDRSLLRITVPTIQIFSDGESCKTLTRFTKDAARQMLRPLMGKEKKKEVGSYVNGTISPISGRMHGDGCAALYS